MISGDPGWNFQPSNSAVPLDNTPILKAYLTAFRGSGEAPVRPGVSASRSILRRSSEKVLVR